MSELAPDRRGSPRTVIADTELTVRAFPVPVRLVDISLSGVLLESTVALTQQDQRVIERFADQ